MGNGRLAKQLQVRSLPVRAAVARGRAGAGRGQRVTAASSRYDKARGVVRIPPWALAMEPLRTWTPLFLKAAFAVAALVVFAWIGRGLAVRVVQTVTAADGGAAALPVVAQLPVVPVAALPTGEAGASSPVPPSAHVASDVRATPEDPVYLNQASAEQLRRLPGAGPKRAEAIVELRQRIGKFQRVEDLMRVKGIGRSTIRKWRPLVRLDAPRPADAGAP